MQPATSNQQPATSNQQPATSNQQPATSNQNSIAVQAFLSNLDNTLWNAADKLRNNLDAANYKHIVLGFIF